MFRFVGGLFWFFVYLGFLDFNLVGVLLVCLACGFLFGFVSFRFVWFVVFIYLSLCLFCLVCGFQFIWFCVFCVCFVVLQFI